MVNAIAVPHGLTIPASSPCLPVNSHSNLSSHHPKDTLIFTSGVRV